MGLFERPENRVAKVARWRRPVVDPNAWIGEIEDEYRPQVDEYVKRTMADLDRAIANRAASVERNEDLERWCARNLISIETIE